MKLTGHGITVELPAGWDGRIFRRVDGAPVLHFGSFPLHSGDGDFGAAATGRMQADDVFCALLEYRVDATLRAGHGLFSDPAPVRLNPTDFSARQLQVTREGHVGVQSFFTHARRPFCLYAVAYPHREPLPKLVGRLSRALSTLRLAP